MAARAPSLGKEAPASPDLARALLGGSLVLFGILLLAQFGLLLTRSEPLFLVDSSRIDAVSLPVWAPPLWKREAERALGVGAVVPIFDDALLDRTRARLAALPFVEHVDLVTRRFPRSVAGQISLRRPIALMRSKGQLFAVDAMAVVLPGEPSKPDGGFSFPLPVISTQKESSRMRPPPWGRVWEGSVVEEGVALALEVEPLIDARPGFRIATIDLSNLGGRVSRIESEIALVTDGGVRILWGRSALRNPYGELSPEAKRSNLERVLEEFPRLEGLREVDLRFDRPTVTLRDP